MSEIPRAAVDAGRAAIGVRSKVRDAVEDIIAAAKPHLITDEMVERVARCLAGEDYWDNSRLMTDVEREDWCRDARRALVVALSVEAGR